MKTLIKIRKNVAIALAIVFITQLVLPTGVALASTKEESRQKIQLAILLDTSNSMDGLIDQAKSQLWRLVNEMAKAKVGSVKPDLELALYEYGNDGLSISNGYIRKLSDFTTDLDNVSEQLFSLKTNGGSEYCGQVISTATKSLKWDDSKESLKIIFIAGNEPFNQGQVNYVEACAGAKATDILVNSIYCGNFQEGVNGYWKKGADITGGSYMNIDQDQKTVYINTPYDDQILQLNIQLNKTYIGYGKTGEAKKAKQMEQDNNASKYGQANSVERATSKIKHVYKSESWDLIEASETAGVSVDKLKEDELPVEMKSMNANEKKDFIAKKSKERADVKKKMADLEAKRNAYIAAEKSKTATNSAAPVLEGAMLQSVKKAATAKKMTFE